MFRPVLSRETDGLRGVAPSLQGPGLVAVNLAHLARWDAARANPEAAALVCQAAPADAYTVASGNRLPVVQDAPTAAEAPRGGLSLYPQELDAAMVPKFVLENRLNSAFLFNAARYYTPAGDQVVAAINNRTLYVAQEAGLAHVNPVNAIDSGKAAGQLQKQLSLAAQKGGSGEPFFRCP